MRFVCAGRGRRPRSPPPFGMTAPAARKGTPPASAPACAAAAASSSSTGRPGISTAGRPCRSARSSSSHARTRGISSLCWMVFSRHPAHHRGAHHFPRDKNDRPTRLLPQGRATVISTTKVPIGRRRHSHETRHRHRLERVPHQGRMAVERLDRRTYILAYNPEYGRSHQKQKGFRDKPRNPKGG